MDGLTIIIIKLILCIVSMAFCLLKQIKLWQSYRKWYLILFWLLIEIAIITCIHYLTPEIYKLILFP